MASPVRILHLEDDRNDAELVQATLEADGLVCDVTRVETRAEFLTAVEQGGLDLILADYSLPAFDGLSALTIAREKRPEAPFIFISGALGEEVAIETLKSGATDYVLKGRLSRLAPAVRRALREAEDRAERQRAETALRDSEKRFRALIENSADAIALVSAEGAVVYESPSASRILGYSAEERVGRSAFELIHPDDLEYTRNLFAQLLQQPGVSLPGQLRFRRKDGAWRWMELVGTNLLAEPSVGAVVVNFRDVTERVLAEEAIRQSEEQYRTLVEQASDGIFIANPEGQYVEVNTSGCAMLGYSRAELLRLRITDLVPGEDLASVSEGLAELRAGKTLVRERRLKRKDGALLPVEISSKRLPDGRLQGIVRDITERKQAEAGLAAKNEELRAMTQQLWQTAKLATMGELAASIAHELNNPLGTVSLRVEGLLGQVPANDPSRRALEVIEQEVERMGTLVANLLQFSRRGAQQISTLDVREEIVKTLELIHYQLRQRQIVVAQEFAPDVPLLRADRQQLRQLFLNLFTNASDAMPQGGTLTIRVSAAPDGRPVVVEVVDTGVGIAPEDLPKVGEPFFTTKPEGKGTGLGLAICRRIAQEHGGTLDLTSAGPGRGATVRIALPVKNGSNGSFLNAP